MIIILSITLLLALAISLSSCKIQKSTNKEVKSSGAIVIEARVKHLSEPEYKPMKYDRDDRLLYKDSLFIEERTAIDIYTDTSGKETWKAHVQKYVFVDLPSRSLYDYAFFSDTAKILKSYTLSDSAFKNYGWDYFGTKISRFGKRTQTITDTVINGIIYKRIRNDTAYKSSKGDDQYEITIGYLRCDKKGLPLQFDKWQSGKIGCPVVRVDVVIPQKNVQFLTQINQVADTLTPEELKVFAAWEKNAKHYPVAQ